MTEYIVGLRFRTRSEVLTIEAEDALIAALKIKHDQPEAVISYVRKSNRRGDRRHPHRTGSRTSCTTRYATAASRSKRRSASTNCRARAGAVAWSGLQIRVLLHPPSPSAFGLSDLANLHLDKTGHCERPNRVRCTFTFHREAIEVF